MFPNVVCLQTSSYRASTAVSSSSWSRGSWSIWAHMEARLLLYCITRLSLGSNSVLPCLIRPWRKIYPGPHILHSPCSNSWESQSWTLAVHPVRHLSLHHSIASHLAFSSFIALPHFYVLPGDASAGTGGVFTAATKAIRCCWSAAGCVKMSMWIHSCQNLHNYLHLHCWKLSVELAPKQLAHHQGTTMGSDPW